MKALCACKEEWQVMTDVTFLSCQGMQGKAAGNDMRIRQLGARGGEGGYHCGVPACLREDYAYQRKAREGAAGARADSLSKPLKAESQEGAEGRLAAYLPEVQRELMWEVSAGLWQETDSSVTYAAGTKMGRELGAAPRRLANHQSELVFRSSRNLSPSARDTCRPSAPV